MELRNTGDGNGCLERGASSTDVLMTKGTAREGFRSTTQCAVVRLFALSALP